MPENISKNKALTYICTVPKEGKILVDAATYYGLQETVSTLQLQVDLLTQQLAQLKKMIFGSKHERLELINPNQLSLGLSLGEPTPVEVIKEDIAYTRTKVKEKAQPNRSPLPADLPREVIEIEPEQDTTGMKLIGHEITEKLEMTPAKFYVKQYKRAKYAKADGNGIVIGQLPEFALPKAIAGNSVVMYLLVSKYLDHLPLNRLIKMFARIGLTLSSSTVNDWTAGGINLLSILHERLAQILLSSGYIQMDETPIKVLEKDKKGQKGKSHRGYFWVSHSPQQKVAVFNYSKGRSADFPNTFLNDYNGYLQTDGYGVYDKLEQTDKITLLGCMAHARRYFVEAIGNDKKRSDYFLSELQVLYALEKQLRESKASEEEIYTQRQEIAVPILNRLHLWLKDQINQVLPQSAIGKAIGYALARWDKLVQYTNDGKLQIDNNLIENQIRPVVLGRKNFMFCGSHESAQRAAIIYSLFATRLLNNINPQEWLEDVLQKLPTRKANDLDDLLPHNWKKEKPQDVV